MRGIRKLTGDFALQPRQADVEASLEEVSSIRIAQIHLGIDGSAAGSVIFLARAACPIAPMKQADQPAANNCSGLVPLPEVPGDESMMSKRPSELREAPSRPPVVWVLPV
ncbi:MAG: hypothetical protein WDN69_25985 [Aliidongia sp.]